MSVWRAEVKHSLGAFELDVVLEGTRGVLALVGPNGSGKTTLLRVLAGAIQADVAELELAGTVLASTSRGVWVPMERRRVGYVPQGYQLFPHLSVEDNVAFGLSLGVGKVAKAERRARAVAVLEELGCGALAKRRVGRLSGGEQQRVALARALLRDPAMLLLDEPLSALDAITRRAVRQVLADRLAAFGRPAVLVTHDVRDIIVLNAEVVVLDRGRCVQRGGLEDLRAAPVNGFVEEMVGAFGAGVGGDGS